MNDLIIKPKLPDTCGTCKFGAPVVGDLQVVECRGVPPTPCIVGAQQTVRGPAFQLELMRPRMARLETACALHKIKDHATASDWQS